MRTTINTTIITSPRHQLAILIVANLPSKLSRYIPSLVGRQGFGADEQRGDEYQGFPKSAAAASSDLRMSSL
ncbi:hypothetical protein [Rhodoplanes sp. SY1]|uniref:hypothetical protein n=1 Tax=Rhodoplanes sp. SY1 TaxID=3166646 RepID=UPI0038B4FD65